MGWLGVWVLDNAWYAIILYASFGCLLPAYLFRHQRPTPQIFSRLAFITPRHTLPWILLGNLTLLGGFALLHPWIMDVHQIHADMNAMGLKAGKAMLFFCLYFVCLNPIVEELFWRGTLQASLFGRYPVWLAIGITSVLFGGWHSVLIAHFAKPGWILPLTLVITVGGMIFGWLYYRTGSLLTAILVHGLGADLPIALIIFWLAFLKPVL